MPSLSKWYSAKTLYIKRILKNSSKENVDRMIYEIEERIVLIKARNFNHAISKAMKEAEVYASNLQGYNIDDQKLVTEFHGTCNVFSLDEEIKLKDSLDKAEVYSSLEIRDDGYANRKIEKIKFGTHPVDSKTTYRKKLRIHRYED